MSLTTKLLIVLAALGAGVGAFLATIASRGATPPCPPQPIARWLGLAPEQANEVDKADPTFAAQTEKMRVDLCERRDKLAALLEDAQSPKERILDQVELVIAAQDMLTRRVAAHLLAIRPLLTSQQQQRLMGMCASGLRCAAPCRWRGGEAGQGSGRGGPPWQDGRPDGRRGGRGWGPR